MTQRYADHQCFSGIPSNARFQSPSNVPSDPSPYTQTQRQFEPCIPGRNQRRSPGVPNPCIHRISSHPPSNLSSNQQTYIKRLPLPMQRINNIDRRDRLALLHIHNRADIAHYTLQKAAQIEADLCVNRARDALDAAAAREAADVGFGDALDVVAEDFAVGACQRECKAEEGEVSSKMLYRWRLAPPLPMPSPLLAVPRLAWLDARRLPAATFLPDMGRTMVKLRWEIVGNGLRCGCGSLWSGRSGVGRFGEWRTQGVK